MEDLAIDTRQWGRWPMERLFDFLAEYMRAGYRYLPDKILITWEQRPYLLGMVMEQGQPRIEIRSPNETVIHTPFNDMKIEVVDYRTEHEA
jgi:hypothetical protein